MKAILFDATRCIGCRCCEDACAEHNDKYKRIWSKEKTGGFRKPSEGLSSDKWISMSFHPLPLPAGAARKNFEWCDAPDLADEKQYTFTRHACMHCVNPACASACIVGALIKTEDGPVVYDSEKCIGCRYCMVACPFQVPKWEWHEPRPYVRKCTLCSDLVSKGKMPACVDICPGNCDGPALIFGERADMVFEAEKRIRTSPGQYVPKVYGADEAGGTCVLYISSMTPEAMGFNPKIGTRALPEYSKGTISSVPYLTGGLAVFLGGLYWVIKRRDEVRLSERAESSEKTKGGS